MTSSRGDKSALNPRGRNRAAVTSPDSAAVDRMMFNVRHQNQTLSVLPGPGRAAGSCL